MSMWMMRRHRVWAVTEQLRCHEIMELFQRLAEGHAARITVVTPNRRLAQALTAEFDAFQIAKGLSVWEAPDILPFGAFVERLWEDALYSELGDKLPLLLTPQQELLLWQEVIATSGEGKDLLFTETAAAHCRDAWGLLHQWRIGAARGNEDHSAFSEWARQYEKEARGDGDAAGLPDLVAGLLDRLKRPKLLVAYAFDLGPPQTAEFLRHFECVEVKPEAVQGSSFRASFASAKEELECAAKWARARLEEGRARIGVVVPRLETRRKEVVRVFSRVLQPGYHLPGAQKAPLPFNVSLGEPLSSYALVDAALTLLDFSFHPIDFARASGLIRSPFLAGAESEMARHATLDVRLRRKLEATVALPKLIAFAEPCPLLRQALEKVFALAGEAGEKSPSEWARHFSALLEAAGFPGERALAFGRRITQEWAGSAKEVVFSWPGKEEDRDLAPSPLILEIPASSLSLPDYLRYRDLLFASKKLESFEDSKAPPVQVKQVRGGTRVLADQAACPFRAFARWRLAAEGLEEPTPGLDARKRGSLLHHLMKHFWSRVKTSQNLRHDLDPAIVEAA